jgi:DNA polymerase elongation subunit (family B)
MDVSDNRGDINIYQSNYVAETFELDENVRDYSSGLPPIIYTGGELHLKSRNDFVHKSALESQIAQNKQIFFMPADVYETNEYSGGTAIYKLYLFGNLIDGSKAQVILDDIPVFFDVRIQNEVQNFDILICELLAADNIQYNRVENIYARPMFGYKHKELNCPYMRIYFNNLQLRKRGIDLLRQKGYETASDDRSSYYRKAAREFGFSFTDWNVLKKYTYQKSSQMCGHKFYIGVSNIAAFVDLLDDSPQTEINSKIKERTPLLSHVRQLIMTFDIETYSPHKDLGVPNADRPDDEVFMICCTAHWRGSAEPLAQVCLSLAPCDPDDRWDTVICSTQYNLLCAFAALFHKWAPDIITGFNDGRYDWPFLVKKAQQNNLLAFWYTQMSAVESKKPSEEGILKWNYREDQRIKISAEKVAWVSYFHVPGCVPIDTRVMYMQLFPKSEKSSLNYFLKSVGLSSKADMPYTRMHQIYETRDAVQMRHVAHYCIIDAKRCQELLVRSNIIADRCEVGAYSFTSLFDCVFYANGHKVCNMLIAYAIRQGFVCSNIVRSITGEHYKYPGAHVVSPEKGLEEDSPITGLDFVSLYPSIIMAYNLSPERFVATTDEAKKLKAQGVNLHYVDFPLNGQQVFGWFVRHDNIQSEIGLYPKVLIDLFEKRKQIKLKLKVLEAQKEHAEILIATQGDFEKVFNNAKAESTGEILQEMERFAANHPNINLTDYKAEHRELVFKLMAADSKQKAIKVFMNTFYGEAGHNISPFFLLQLAGGVTTAGQHNLFMVQKYVKDEGFHIKYGDTDSLYIACPQKCYLDATAKYTASNQTLEDYEKYCAKKVKITIHELNILRDKVNIKLMQDNGTKYLKMDYEEVLFPVVFTGKKKYYGIPHINVPNFHPKKLFIRGIDVIKQGQTELAKTIGNRIMWESMKLRRPTDLRPSMLEIVQNILQEAVQNVNQWKIEDFIQSDAWKPNKDNKAVQRFMQRMRVYHEKEKEENAQRLAGGLPILPLQYTEPEPGERFSYIVIKVESRYDERGYKINVSRKGDKMEYVDIARKQILVGKMQIDVQFYLSNYVVGLCARFINYLFQPNENRQFDAQELDNFCNDEARKFLERFLRDLNPENKTVALARSYAYKRAWKIATEQTSSHLIEKLGCNAEFFINDSYELFLSEGDIIDALVKSAYDNTTVDLEIIDNMLKQLDIKQIYSLSNNLNPQVRKSNGFRWYPLSHFCTSALFNIENQLRQELVRWLPKIVGLVNRYQDWLSIFVENCRKCEHDKNDKLGKFTSEVKQPNELSLSVEDQNLLHMLRNRWYQFIGIHKSRIICQEMQKKISIIKNHHQKHIQAPVNIVSNGLLPYKSLRGNSNDPFAI